MATLTKRGLHQVLKSHGFSRREAELLTTALFDAIIKALTYRQSVQLPFGKLEVRKTPRPTRQLAFGTIVERFKSKYRIVFIPEDIEGISDDEHY